MKILIPTAKEMNDSFNFENNAILSKISQNIINEMSSKSKEELMKIYKIKEDKAKLEYDNWQSLKNNNAESTYALNLFNGLMYRNINRDNLSEEEINYLKNNVFITSSLYGIINVFEKISAHRLDFLQKVLIKEKTLKKLWQEHYDEWLMSNDYVISLLSSEFEEVFSKKLREKLIKVTFMENKNGELKVHSTISKKARGKFLTALVEKKVENINQVKNIKFSNFKYNEKLSKENNLVFVAE